MILKNKKVWVLYFIIFIMVVIFICSRPDKSDKKIELNDLKVKGDIPVLCVLCNFNDSKIVTSTEEWHERIFGQEESLKEYYYENSNKKINLVPARVEKDNESGVIEISVDDTLQDNPDKYLSDYDNTYRLNIYKQIEYIIKKYAGSNHQLDQDELKIIIVMPAYQYASVPEGVSGVVSFQDHTLLLARESGIKSWASFISELAYDQYNKKMQAPLGTMLHEFGHLMYLPDLYNVTNQRKGYGAGFLSPMGWGYRIYTAPDTVRGTVPVNLDAYCKTLLGIVTPTAVTNTNSYKLYSQGTGKYNVLKIPTKSKYEYYLLENRQFEGNDLPLKNYIKHPGIAIWHINEIPVQKFYDNAFGKYDSTWIDIIGSPVRGVDLVEANEGKLGYGIYDTKVQGSQKWPYNGTDINDTDILFYSYDGGNTFFEDKEAGFKIEAGSSGDIMDVITTFQRSN